MRFFKHPMPRNLSIGLAALILSACAIGRSTGNSLAYNASSGIADNVEDCRTLLSRAPDDSADSLEPGSIGLLNWNIRKGSMIDWQSDLRTLSAGADLITLQEAVLDAGMELEVQGGLHTAFSRGFTTRRKTTGVATYSTAKPLSECRLLIIEPLMRTPKATSITEFALAGRSQTLVVVNVHAVNLTVGLIRFRDQMARIRRVLAVHDGPAILSGDFNTWRPARMAIVQDMVSAMRFAPVVPTSADERKTFNGLPLDHVFVRGLTVTRSETRTVSSSDHNPMLLEFHL